MSQGFKFWAEIGNKGSEYKYLRLHFLPIHVAIPGLGIQAHVSFDGFKPLGRGFITPCSVFDDLFVVFGGLEIPVCSAAFPFAEGGVGGGMEGEGEGSARKVVCLEKSVVRA